MAKIEIASFNRRAALIAQENGADRIEFCAGMEVGGTTPDIDDVITLRKELDIDLNVMIRPRGGDFVYSADEFEQMKRALIRLKEQHVDGFVFGILNRDNTMNKDQNKELVELASPLPCTFHRAFDDVVDMDVALEDVISCGFTTILTSGCEPDVMMGLTNLKHLVHRAEGRIVIMPGGGLRSTNVEQVLRETAAVYFHSSAITDGGNTAVAQEVRELKEKVS
ncbi:copper homeostasis protein CutC [Sphingobacterium faecale]|uniref:PF03932 family protein CutC n=1 Tax=Sphingobacterium faecale TaxID=2803775 RepID=A0ABS1QZ65_9SPHI|nr:copper homeostasis protein CutC [Sphingobacterium faecale]MBL1407721.1 copper homeostasis protein CutC [Sphingobacterium faecale]